MNKSLDTNQLNRIETLLAALCAAWDVKVPALPKPETPRRKYVTRSGAFKPTKKYPGRGLRWNQKEDALLLELRALKVPYKQIAKKLGRSWTACSVRWSALQRGVAR